MHPSEERINTVRSRGALPISISWSLGGKADTTVLEAVFSRFDSGRDYQNFWLRGGKADTTVSNTVFSRFDYERSYHAA